MKLPVRDIHTTHLAIRITAPEFRKEGTQRIPLLSWADDSSNHHRTDCTRKLFLAAAGDNEVGEKPDGMDRLMNHHFYVHMNAEGVAIGLDVIPSRTYGSRVVPASQVGVDTLKLQYAQDGSGVVRILQRPVNTKHPVIRRLIAALDAYNGKAIKVGDNPIKGNAARIVSISDGVVEVKLSSRARREAVHSSASMLEPDE